MAVGQVGCLKNSDCQCRQLSDGVLGLLQRILGQQKRGDCIAAAGTGNGGGNSLVPEFPKHPVCLWEGCSWIEMAAMYAEEPSEE